MTSTDDPTAGCDLAVIGAGPAGMAAAVAASGAGLRVTVLDAAPRLGGQYFRNPPESMHRRRRHAHPRGDASHRPVGAATLDGLRSALVAVDHRPRHRVWAVERRDRGGFAVHATCGDRRPSPVTVTARTVLIATGGYDRPLPFPGWDLPGVYTAGGVQALLKGNLVTAGTRVAVGGTGPFLLPVATGLLAAGAAVAGVYEAGRAGAMARLGRHAGPDKAVEAAGYLATLARHRAGYRTGHAIVAAHGDTAVRAVTVAELDRNWRIRPGSERTVTCDAVAVGYGFTPQLELAVQLGCATGTDPDGSAVVTVDAAQRTGVPGVYAAGESTGVGGAQLALVEGELAGLAVARTLAGAEPGHRLPGLLRRRGRLRGFAAALQAAYPIGPGWPAWLADDTVVCRCEEVTAGHLAAVAGEFGPAARTAKLLGRAGMGWCQGRVCGYATGCLAASAAGVDGRGDASVFARRPIAQPVTLGNLAKGG